MHELLWLLLPVAALSGWWIGRRGGSDEHHDAFSPQISDAYFQGLNYLLNEERDKALEVFTRMVEVDSDTAETHLALGSVFRRRGEVDRAIRIHQNLIARPSLTRRQRTYALLALGEDYMKAGVFDRAEKLFQEVVEQDAHVEQALRRLLTIYEHEREWDRAIETAERLEQVGEGDYRVRIGQLRCEQAAHALARGYTEHARKALRRALSADPDCARANMLLGDLERELGRYKAAVKAYEAVGQQDPALLPEVLDGLAAAYRGLGRSGQMETFLRDTVTRMPDGRLMVRLAEVIRERRGTQAAIRELTLMLRRQPSLDGIRRLVALTHSVGEPIGPREMQILLDLFEKLEAGRALYRCRRCGFSARTLFWQCPGCQGWASIRPQTETEDR
ncbi:lipopolysaccharide assembly protein LapB [Halorhodospira halophila]|uniref:Lipopolysaccharide assembly protein B n=1 Tax=Halorhodospira halophila (strain DSM 244 / SL1) TaxID=349124 RepID=A1WUI4_HALHL|nr:lipopolysaccharide assembly protein LapB [Halorhodospira halophila]ABM61346.1 Tetratricopeptide TPR_2 repeat protein [Halorhodospira halophila SL1]MBK1729071.1 lipopolysaccharide assembly protein LapB [Halorhodospira halophila]